MIKYLVTCDDFTIWPPNKSNVIFLGEWCTNNIELTTLKDFEYKYELLTHKWRDRDNLINDFDTVNKLIDDLNIKLTEYLNKYHKVDFNKQYWEILLSPWLSYFVGNIFEKIILFEKGNINNIDNYNYITKYFELSNFISKDTKDYADNFSNSTEWSLLIFNEIIENYLDYNINLIKKKNYTKLNTIKNTSKLNFRKILKFLNIFSAKNNLVINQSSLGKFNSLKNYITSFNFPIISCEPDITNYKIDLDLRKQNTFSKNDKLQNFLFYLAKKYLPLCYLENFKKYNIESKKIYHAKKTKIILTSTGHYFDEIFKIYIANQKTLGSKLLIIQHGGSYGQAICNFNEYYDLKISDLFFSWGWKKNNESKIISFGYPNTKCLKKIKKNNKLLFLLNESQKFTNMMSGNPTGPMIKDYIIDQELFYENLSNHIKKSTYIKKYTKNYGWKCKLLDKSYYHNINFEEDNKTNAVEIFKKYKVVVCGWNSTSYLETLYNNIPTIIFWRSDICKSNKDSMIKLNQLNSVGIFHHNPKSAAEFLNKNFYRIEDWWTNIKLQEVKNNFIEFYIKQSNCDDLMNFHIKPFLK